jgi:hypothetical protein
MFEKILERDVVNPKGYTITVVTIHSTVVGPRGKIKHDYRMYDSDGGMQFIPLAKDLNESFERYCKFKETCRTDQY